MKWGKPFTVFLVLMLAAGTAFASGFRLPEAGVKAMGMGFAFTAQADDPSAIYFNPAGLTQLEGNNVMVGVTYVHEDGAEFTGVTPLTGGQSVSETQKTLHFAIPNAYFTGSHKGTGIHYGIGFFTPFGLGQQYENVNTSIFRNQATKIDLKTFVINPTVAFEIADVLSVGFGIDYMYGMAKLGKTPYSATVAALNPEGDGNLYNLELEGDGDAWGYNFGLLLKPVKNLRIGASYRSPFELNLSNGDVTISDTNVAYLSGLLGPTPASTNGSATVKMPATFALGVAYTINRLTVEFDADWTFWSRYDSLPIDIADRGTTPTLYDTDNYKGWKDVCALRFGAEYKVTDPLALRLGVVYDPTPVPAETMGPELPDSDRMNYMIGAGYKIGAITIDAAFMYIDKKDRTVNNLDMTTGTGFNGTWTGDAWLAGLDVSYKF